MSRSPQKSLERLGRRGSRMRPVRRLSRVIEATGIAPPLNWLVHHGVFDRWETLLDVSPGSLRIRLRHENGSYTPWRRRRLKFARPHRIALLPSGEAIVADTDHNRLLVLERLNGGRVRCRTRVGGQDLLRPHDVAWNPHDGNIYVVDARGVFRLSAPGSRGEAWIMRPRTLGYARAIVILDRHVHIIASTRGTVLRIDDFLRHRLTEFRSPAKRGRAPAGSWRATGLILNDVAFLEGWFYGTNYFSPDHASNGDARPHRFIRWRHWADFRAGRWQDLSSGIEPGLVPYFLTVAGNHLHIAAFCHADHSRDAILRFDPRQCL